MLAVLLVAPLVQAAAMLADEGVFHRRRGLPRWERIGHPLDTSTAGVCYAWLLANRPSSYALSVYAALAMVSCLFITKDEIVHARLCEPMETWLHAVLFVLHPVVFVSFGAIWMLGLGTTWIYAALAATIAFGLYQTIYWNLVWKPQPARTT